MGQNGGPQHQTQDILQSYLDPRRDEVQRPDEVVRIMGLHAGQTVADVGAGSGYFSWHFSKAVGAGGAVFAVDVDPQAIDFMKQRMTKQPPPFSNIQLVSSAIDDVKLKPDSLDWVFLCEAHFFVEGDPSSMACLRTIRRALKENGKVAIIEVKNDPLRGQVSFERLLASFVTAGFALDSKHDIYEREYFVIMK